MKSKIKLFKLKVGFTLAEVLITLVIIGVVATITVPVMIQNTQNEELVSRLKKVNSTLQQATDMIMMEEGNAGAQNGGWAKDVDAVYNLYKKHLNITKDCGSASGCFAQGDNKKLNGLADNNIWDTKDYYRKVILQDGTQIMFIYWNNNCSYGSAVGSENVCAGIWADINGEKKPNQFGRDVFLFVIKDNAIFPAGCDIEGDFCSKTSDGRGCACKVLSENAMNY